MTIHEAGDQKRGLLNLHSAVKAAYARILKHNKKDLPAHGQARRKISTLLPQDMPALFRLVDAVGRNKRNLATLVRLGRVIHYEASGGLTGSPGGPVDDWPADISASRFWTSDGQTEIKRNEALVRVWRHALAISHRTLTDWADPDAKIDRDILGSNETEKAIRNFNADAYARKLDLLFGSRANLVKGAGDDEFQRAVLKLAIEWIAALRNASFHFKGLGAFAEALTGAAKSPTHPRVNEALRKLWEDDFAGRAEWLRRAMRADHFEFFFKEQQNRKLFAALYAGGEGGPPLPRFARILLRAENAWQGQNLRLPSAANRLALENPARKCQYSALKLLYERPFRVWLEKLDAAALNRFIDRAVNRTTKAARNLNARGDRDRRDMIEAKAKALGRLVIGESVEDFFFRLSAATASEMRVQRGYDSDADAAREQASYLEDLKCDVVALAFEAYLREAEFGFVLQLAPDALKPERALSDLDEMVTKAPDVELEDWRCRLYFLLHLVPVDEAGRLLHQLRKWEILAKGSMKTEGFGGKARRDLRDARTLPRHARRQVRGRRSAHRRRRVQALVRGRRAFR